MNLTRHLHTIAPAILAVWVVTSIIAITIALHTDQPDWPFQIMVGIGVMASGLMWLTAAYWPDGDGL